MKVRTQCVWLRQNVLFSHGVLDWGNGLDMGEFLTLYVTYKMDKGDIYTLPFYIIRPLYGNGVKCCGVYYGLDQHEYVGSNLNVYSILISEII